MLVSRDAVFLEDQFMETDDRYEGERCRTSGVDCVANGDDSNEEESNVIEVAPNSKPIVELSSVSYIIPTDVDHVNLPVQPTYEEAFMHTLPMQGTKRQVKPFEKVAYCLRATSLFAHIIEQTFEEAWHGSDANEWRKMYR